MPRRAVVLFPNGDADHIEDFRQLWDPLALAVPAHITLAYPFDDGDDATELMVRLEQAAAKAEPFGVQLAEPTVVDKEYLFLMVSHGADHVRALHNRIYDDVLQLPRPNSFVPHMTVGRQQDPRGIVQAQRAARDQGLAFAGDVSSVSLYRIEAGSRVREFEIALGQRE